MMMIVEGRARWNFRSADACTEGLNHPCERMPRYEGACTCDLGK